MNIFGRAFGVVMGYLLAFSVSATEFNETQIKERFSKIGVSVMQVESIEVDGLVEVTTNQGTLYATPAGDYVISGTLYSLDNKGNLQDVAALRNGPKIVGLLDQRSDEVIVYKADNEKHVVTVFTDISCGYCLKLHRQMAEYNKLGITVRYLAFPRSGDRSDIGQTMANIWCSADPVKAMNDAKLRGENINASSGSIQQCQTMVSEHHQLGKAIGVSGTPAVYTSKGLNVGGYLSPEDLLKRLESQG